MKATEYFEKYKDRVSTAKTAEDFANVIDELYSEMRKEMYELVKKRRIASLSSTKSLILEFNQKWNKIIRLFEEANIKSYMKKDGFYHSEQKILERINMII